MSEAKSSQKIDWNDPLVIRYHALKMKPKIIAQARRNMVKYLKNQGNYKIKHGSEKDEAPKRLKKKMLISHKRSGAEMLNLLSTKYQNCGLEDFKFEREFLVFIKSFKEDGSSKNYKVLSEMLEDFDRQDVEELYRLVKE
ncbi:hypothetical protein Tco_1092724 [Tanacetum coccineum]|uniref:Uncharacterized protein n=1 Tax=Tanacetum coccineum TaxID=301880 RepID=A0ABQ5IAQ6_9ASTR